MVDEVSGNIVVELRKRENFGGFREERGQLLLEEMCNEVEYDLKALQESAGQLEECSDSKGMNSVLNGSTLNIILGEAVFICFLSPINFLTAFV